MLSRRKNRPLAGPAVRRPRPARPVEAAAQPRAPRARLEALENRTLLAADVVISEFLADNDNGITDLYNEHSDWIELHNRGDTAQNLDGFFLTDSSTELTRWRLPAVNLNPGTYLTVFASGADDAVAGSQLHTNFALAADGEYLALVRPDGLTVQHAYSPRYPDQTKDISYGLSFERQAGNFEEQHFTQPTPGAANIPNSPAPVFSARGRTFANAFNLTLSAPLAGAEIRYTTDRTLPTAASPLYTGPIPISASTIVRARVFSAGRTPGPVVGETFLALDASVQNFNSNLPVVVLDTFGAGVADSPQTMVGSVIIDTAADDGRAAMLDAPDFAGRAGLNVRGQTSAGFPKKQWHFEVWDENNQDKNASLLGMPADSDWVLYAPYSEKILMQNHLAYMWSNRIGQYAVRTRFVEVFVNGAAGSKIDYAGDYQGVYILMEKIKIDDNRVDIAQMGPGDNAGDDVTGGYIFRKDKPDPGEPGFSAAGNSFRFEDPSAADITPAQQQYITNYLNEFKSVLDNDGLFKDPLNGYAKYIDVDSFIDHHIIVELTKNIDGYRISTYYSKDRLGKIKMGPVWDYNLSLGNADYNDGGNPTGWYHSLLDDGSYPFFRRLFQDPNFQQKYIDRWQELRKNELSTDRLMADIDDAVRLLSDGNGNYPVGNNPPQVANNPVVRNFQKWQNLAQDLWPNYYVDPSWINHVNWTKNWLTQRVNWWDAQYLRAPGITPPGGAVTSPTQVTITSTGATTNVDTPMLQYGAPARAVVPTADTPANWTSRTFNDGAWDAGTTGVGYDNNGASNGDLAPFIGLTTNIAGDNNSVYIRVRFNVDNPASVQNLILKMRYDDGFVAYLNGTRVAASPNAPAAPAWNSDTGGNTHESTTYEEFNITAFKSALVSGTNVLAIQGINANLTSSDLLIIPELVNRTSTVQQAPVYYTTDGTDPRLSDGNLNPAALLYSGPFTVSTTARVMARSRVGTRWSGLSSETYDFGTNRLRISEIMYNPAPATTGSYLPGDFEYVELINTGTQAMPLAGSRFTNGIDYTFGSYTLQPGARVVVVKNLAAFQSRYGTGRPVAPGTFTGSLSDGGERVRLLGRMGEVVHDFSYSDDWYRQTDGQGWSLTAVDTAQPLAAWGTKDGWRASEPVNGTPGQADDAGVRPNSVVINEIMTNPVGGGGDWIELRNTTNSTINISNWWLSDTPSTLKKWRIPAGSLVPGGGYLVFTEAQFGSAFSFSANGEGVYLSSGDASGNIGGYRVDETFLAADAGVSFGRTPLSTGGADFTALTSPTQGLANAAPVVGPVVINEIMYNPLPGKSEYVELRNITGAAVSLQDWKFSGGIDWAFPAGASIPANGYVIVAAVDPATFRTQYNVPAGVTVFGPYTLANGTNVLSNDGESVRLVKPVVGSTTAFVTVDRVAYDDNAPWPAETDGTGQSLGRVNSAAYGNDPANWAAELLGGSPGRPNLDNSAPTADVVDVAPDPRTAPVTSISIVFSEPVTGVDRQDLRLTRNGSDVTLTGSHTVTTGDGGITWVLGNIGGLTSAAGTYVLTLVAAGSGITDAGGRAMVANASDTWVTNQSDTSAPSANITDVTPDPRTTAVGTITVVFNEAVTGVDLADFTLARNGGGNLLTAAQSITSADGITWTLAGLSSLTGADGAYVLTLNGSGTGIADLSGNALAGGATDAWTTDATRPTADVVDVVPDPRSAAVNSITIVFSEPVLGLDHADLRLGRDGGANLITAAQTLSTPDGGVTWVVGNLGGLTTAGGNYAFWVATAGAGIADAAGNTLATVDPADAWSVDAAAPAADVVDITPDPRTDAVNTVTITFTEPVTGFGVTDLQLFRDGGATNLITAAQTLNTTDGRTFVLGNLAGVTGAPGTYTLTLVAGVSGIADAAGNSLPADASDTWQTQSPDATAPTADVIDVTPDPRNTAVQTITIVFSEPVTGIDFSDLMLTADGGPDLITAAQSPTTADGGRTWVVGNLAALTSITGNYHFRVVTLGSGITDLAGNALATVNPGDEWLVDFQAPVFLIQNIIQPHPAPLQSIDLSFNEEVTGFGIGDLRLTRAGSSQNLLTAAQTLTPTGGSGWRLDNLSSVTGQGGTYTLTLVAAGSGIADLAGNAVEADVSRTFALDADAPTAAIAPVTPDPRSGGVDTVTITFSEAVINFELADLRLGRDGGANLLTGAQTLNTPDGGVTWTLGNLAGITGEAGTYTLTLVANGSGITDQAGNALAANAADTWTVVPPVAPSPSQVYVRGSGWAGADALPNNVTFKEYLAANGLGHVDYGYLLPASPSATATVPWINVDEIVVRYDAPFPAGGGVPSAADFSLAGIRSGYEVRSVTQLDPQTFVLRLDRALGVQPASAGGGADGDRLEFRATGAGGSNFLLGFNVLQGDADQRSNRVNATDVTLVRARQNRNASEAPQEGQVPYTPFADLNADGRINATDVTTVRARQNDTVPEVPAAAGSSLATASMTEDLFGSQPILA